MALSWSVSRDVYKRFGCKLFKDRLKYRCYHICRKQLLNYAWLGSSRNSVLNRKCDRNYPFFLISPTSISSSFHGRNCVLFSSNKAASSEDAVLKNKARQEEKRRQKEIRRQGFEERQKSKLKVHVIGQVNSHLLI